MEDGDTLDDITPVDSPSASIVRFAEHLYSLCEAFRGVAPLLEAARRADRPFVLEKLVDICADGEGAFRDCGAALAEQLALELVFRPR